VLFKHRCSHASLKTSSTDSTSYGRTPFSNEALPPQPNVFAKNTLTSFLFLLEPLNRADRVGLGAVRCSLIGAARVLHLCNPSALQGEPPYTPSLPLHRAAGHRPCPPAMPRSPLRQIPNPRRSPLP
jgi:hypothetical protein